MVVTTASDIKNAWAKGFQLAALQPEGASTCASTPRDAEQSGMLNRARMRLQAQPREPCSSQALENSYGSYLRWRPRPCSPQAACGHGCVSTTRDAPHSEPPAVVVSIRARRKKLRQVFAKHDRGMDKTGSMLTVIMLYATAPLILDA